MADKKPPKPEGKKKPKIEDPKRFRIVNEAGEPVCVGVVWPHGNASVALPADGSLLQRSNLDSVREMIALNLYVFDTCKIEMIDG